MWNEFSIQCRLCAPEALASRRFLFFASRGREQKHDFGSRQQMTVTETMFKCHLCSLEFKRKYNLQRHVSSVHEQDSRFECEACDRKYKRKRDLDRHVNDIHLKVRPFVCDDCEMTFAGAEQLRKHRKVKHGRVDATVESTSAMETQMSLESKCDFAISAALAQSVGEVLQSAATASPAPAAAANEASALAVAVESAQRAALAVTTSALSALVLQPAHVHREDCGHVAVMHDGHMDWIVDGRLETAECEDHGAAPEPDEKTLNEWLAHLL